MSITREWCAMCNRVSPVGFHVPDEVWAEVVHPRYQHSTICLSCFAARADEMLIEWDRDIALFPVSLKTHIAEGEARP